MCCRLDIRLVQNSDFDGFACIEILIDFYCQEAFTTDPVNDGVIDSGYDLGLVLEWLENFELILSSCLNFTFPAIELDELWIILIEKPGPISVLAKYLLIY